MPRDLTAPERALDNVSISKGDNELANAVIDALTPLYPAYRIAAIKGSGSMYAVCILDPLGPADALIIRNEARCIALGYSLARKRYTKGHEISP